jgi:flagellar basal body-associated protein FliL
MINQTGHNEPKISTWGERSMNRTNLIIFTLVILLGALALSIYFQSKPVTQNTTPAVQQTLPQEPVKKPIVHYPVPEVIAEPAPSKQTTTTDQAISPKLPQSLPAIQESDQSIQEALSSLLSDNTGEKLLFMENFIQKFVTTIDNLPEKRLPRAHLPVKAPGGKFLVAGTTEAPQTSSRNDKRYSTYVTLLESINQDLALKTYTYYYPLFQTAYEQLGYQNAYFNDRLVYVIDHLLETPNPPDPILLAHTAVLFTYADPSLEQLSSGQKILLRLGQDQRTRVLKILDSYRQKLTKLHP